MIDSEMRTAPVTYRQLRLVLEMRDLPAFVRDEAWQPTEQDTVFRLAHEPDDVTYEQDFTSRDGAPACTIQAPLVDEVWNELERITTALLALARLPGSVSHVHSYITWTMQQLEARKLPSTLGWISPEEIRTAKFLIAFVLLAGDDPNHRDGLLWTGEHLFTHILAHRGIPH